MSDVFDLPPKKLLVRLLAPIAVGFIMLMVIDFADLLVAGFISDLSIAVLGYSYALVYFMIAIGFGLNQGLTIVGSEANIQQGSRALYQFFTQAIFLSVFAAICLVGLTLSFLHFQWVDAEILPYFSLLEDYLHIILLAILPMFLLLLLCAICQIKGKPEIIRNTLALMLLSTIIIHPILSLPQGEVFQLFGIKGFLPLGFNLGITGIALSKFIVTVFGLVYSASRAISWREFSLSGMTFSAEKCWSLAKQAFPAAAIQLLVPSYLIMLTKIITGYGINVLAGFTLGYRIVMVVIIPILGVLVALLVVITHDMVSKSYERVKETLKLTLVAGSAIVFVVLLVSNVITAYGFGFLTGGEKYLVAQQYLLLAVYITVLEYIIGICIVSFQSVKKPLLAFIVASFRTIVIPAPILYWLSLYDVSLMGVWYGIALSFTLAAIASVTVSYSVFWKKFLN